MSHASLSALHRPGALRFSASAFVARMPMAMVSLGIVLLVADRTGSYSQAGTVSAAFLAANAVCAVAQARWIDVRGQARVLAPAAVLSTAGMVGTVLSVEARAGRVWPHLWAALAGAALPQIGSSVRARWAHVLPDKAELHAAFALESVLDEVVFIVGPALVTLLATAVHPLAGLATAGVATAVGTALFVGQRHTEPPVAARSDRSSSAAPMPWVALAPLVVCAFTMGALLGGAEVATVAFAEGHDSTRMSGPLLAVWAVGSLVAGIVVGAVSSRSSTATRFRWSTVALGLLVVPLPFVGSLTVLAAALFVSGCAISPTLIAGFARVEEVVPPSRLTEGIALFTTGLGLGLAPGSALAGWAAETAGPAAGFWVPVGAGLAGALVAVAGGRAASPVAEVRARSSATEG